MCKILETTVLCIALVIIGIADSIRKFFYPYPEREEEYDKENWQEKMCDELGWEYKDSSGNY